MIDQAQVARIAGQGHDTVVRHHLLVQAPETQHRALQFVQTPGQHRHLHGRHDMAVHDRSVWLRF